MSLFEGKHSLSLINRSPFSKILPGNVLLVNQEGLRLEVCASDYLSGKLSCFCFTSQIVIR